MPNILSLVRLRVKRRLNKVNLFAEAQDVSSTRFSLEQKFGGTNVTLPMFLSADLRIITLRRGFLRLQYIARPHTSTESWRRVVEYLCYYLEKRLSALYWNIEVSQSIADVCISAVKGNLSRPYIPRR